MKIIKMILLLILLIPCLFYAQYKTEAPVKLIWNSEEIFMAPAWSPDGKYISFSGSNYKGLFLYNSENKEIKTLSEEDAAGFGFEWSPDSKAIVTRVAKYEGVRRFNAVKIFDIEQNESRQITDFRTMITVLPKWNSTGEKIYLPGKDKIEVFESGEKSNSLNKKSSNDVFLEDDKIAVGDVNSENLNFIKPVENKQLLNLAVSPDNSKVVFEVLGGNLFTMETDGTNLVDLGKGFRASWSPDSKSLVYMITVDDGHQYLSSDLYIINADGSGKEQLTFTTDKLEMNPSWSPHGSKILYDELKEGAIYQIKFAR